MAVGNLNTGAGIQPTIVDAKGDLIVGTANDAVSRLGVTGPTGSVLVTDAGETTGLKWVDPGTVGGLVHINTTPFTSVSAISLPNDTFSSTYDNYRIVFSAIQNTSNGVISIRMRASGSDNSTSNYASGGYFGGITSAVSRINSSGQTSIATVGPTATNRVPIILDLTNPFDSVPTLGFWQSFTTSFGDLFTSLFQFGANTSFDSMSFITSAGTISGSVSAYGYRKS
jgi:hypothetical protein